MEVAMIMLRSRLTEEFLESIFDDQPVLGLTHNFYRYPARFSPRFVRATIKCFTEQGDLVVDPFMGSGTTLVESRVLSRVAFGTDISELAAFIARVKTTVYVETNLYALRNWVKNIDVKLNRRCLATVNSREGNGTATHANNLNSKSTWPIRITIDAILSCIDGLSNPQQAELARCALLKTGQWALDCRDKLPSALGFRSHFAGDIEEVCRGAREFALKARSADGLYENKFPFRTLCQKRSAIGIESDPSIFKKAAPRLILTSPPYPGIHVLYHRWQILGRKETAAPFWITSTKDGQGESYYTFGDRKQKSLEGYYDCLLQAFLSLSKISDDKTWVVQMVAFSDPHRQLPRFLRTISMAGFQEIQFSDVSNSADGRIWRIIPNRKWYATQNRSISSRYEVVLFHKLT